MAPCINISTKRVQVPKLSDLPFDRLYQIYYANGYNKETSSQDIGNTEIMEIKSKFHKKHVCKYCNKIYNHSSSMYKHIKKEHSNKINYEETIKNLQDKVEDLEAKLNSVNLSTIINDNSSTTNNNTTNNNTITRL